MVSRTLRFSPIINFCPLPSLAASSSYKERKEWTEEEMSFGTTDGRVSFRTDNERIGSDQVYIQHTTTTASVSDTKCPPMVLLSSSSSIIVVKKAISCQARTHNIIITIISPSYHHHDWTRKPTSIGRDTSTSLPRQERQSRRRSYQ